MKLSIVQCCCDLKDAVSLSHSPYFPLSLYFSTTCYYFVFCPKTGDKEPLASFSSPTFQGEGNDEAPPVPPSPAGARLHNDNGTTVDVVAVAAVAEV